MLASTLSVRGTWIVLDFRGDIMRVADTVLPHHIEQSNSLTNGKDKALVHFEPKCRPLRCIACLWRLAQRYMSTPRTRSLIHLWQTWNLGGSSAAKSEQFAHCKLHDAFEDRKYSQLPSTCPKED
jgi:hypothetical protein